MPACGKTTLGRALAARLGVPLCDTDAEVERLAGIPVRRIFAERGEEAFRRLEAQVIERMAGSPRAPIVACGGGTPCYGHSLQLMLDTGIVVWLQASTERTLQRLAEQPGQRPRLQGLEGDALRRALDDELHRRAPFYSRAPFTFDSSRLDTPAEIEDTVQRFITQFLPDGK